jgi:hypothetical protein
MMSVLWHVLGGSCACSDITSGGCAFEAATAAPWGKFGRLGKLGKWLGRLFSHADEAGDAARAVRWVDEGAGMSDEAAAYQAGAYGARSNVATGRVQAPELNGVRFDGFDESAGVLIDRKLSVTTFAKSQNQALRQSQALAAGGYRGRWEVPTSAEAARATRMFDRLGITNIDVTVVAL